MNRDHIEHLVEVLVALKNEERVTGHSQTAAVTQALAAAWELDDHDKQHIARDVEVLKEHDACGSKNPDALYHVDTPVSTIYHNLELTPKDIPSRQGSLRILEIGPGRGALATDIKKRAGFIGKLLLPGRIRKALPNRVTYEAVGLTDFGNKDIDVFHETSVDLFEPEEDRYDFVLSNYGITYAHNHGRTLDKLLRSLHVGGSLHTTFKQKTNNYPVDDSVKQSFGFNMGKEFTLHPDQDYGVGTSRDLLELYGMQDQFDLAVRSDHHTFSSFMRITKKSLTASFLDYVARKLISSFSTSLRHPTRIPYSRLSNVIHQKRFGLPDESYLSPQGHRILTDQNPLDLYETDHQRPD